MVSVEGRIVGWEEHHPQESCGGNRHKDVPGFIKVLRESPCQETLNEMHDTKMGFK